MKPLTSADLFSGAGGLTEGFHQMGYEVLASLDNWGPAAETHLKNHPATEMFHADILEFDPSELPKVDVLIGSPPCTEFSYANQGGHGDLELGMRFVLRFLRFVHDVKPRYWAMENVPRLLQTLPPRVPLRRLGLHEDGFIDIPVRKVLNSADYGAPQKRLRLFSGKFPLPEATHSGGGSLDRFEGGPPWMTVRDVLSSLPDPLVRREAPPEVSDPNYRFKIPTEELSDHFMDTVLTPEEVRINRKSKVDHSWYGRMAFPDPIDRPARTVMATQTGVSRETLVLDWQKGGEHVFRRPTIREAACFQTFPLTYQFWGRTAETRYKLVGNAVPPVLAAAVAASIAKKVGAVVPPLPLVSTDCPERPPEVGISRRRDGFNARRFPLDRKFRDHIPGSRMGGFRVDIDNIGPGGSGAVPAVRSLHTSRRHPKTWTARLYIGSGKIFHCIAPTFEEALDQLAASVESSDLRRRAERLGEDLERKMASWLPDATTLQAVWAGKVRRKNVGPHEVLWRLAGLVDKHFPPGQFEQTVGPISPGFPRTERTEMPVRIAAFLFAARFATEVIDRKSPGSALGRTSLDEYVQQSGRSLGPARTELELPKAADLVSQAMVSRGERRARRPATVLDSA